MRTVLFDVDGVLVHGYHAKPELQQNWDETLLDDLGVDPARFSREFIYDIFVKQVIIGRMGLVEALDRVLPLRGYKGATLDFVGYWLSHDSRLNEDLLALVRTLKAGGTPLYIATNQEHLRAHWLWQHLGLRNQFSDIFYSARVGAAKPQPQFFEFVRRRIGPQEEPPLFFDDREEIVRAARREGWDAVLFETTADVSNHPWVAARLTQATAATA
jgi:putative hydrolase of the HAD superfamily